jgi:hypothetical protein
VKAKKCPGACDARALKANSNSLTAPYGAFAEKSQQLVDALRVRRLTRAGLPLALALVVAPLAYGQARR